MYIDVIVPSFDESGEDVLISTWYKKIGDKISNGEIIADAETSTITCGITSGYDCFLSKIIAKEGDIVPQGSKIAVIEINVAEPSEETSKENLKESVEEGLKNIHITQNIEEKTETIPEEKKVENSTQDKVGRITAENPQQETPQKEAVAASRAERRQALKDMENGKISAEEIEKMRAQREALQNTGKITQNEIKKEEKAKEKQDEYTLSVSSNAVSDDLVVKTIKDIIDEKDTFDDEDFSSDEIFDEESAITEQKDSIEKDDSTEERNGAFESLTEQAERKFKNILKDTELQAQQEANKLREKIIENAKISALAESEVIKAKILKEYEDKAAKDAGEMQKKIVQGSISEAQNTRTKLIEEAKAEALKEAEEIKSKIKEEAQKTAEEEAALIKRNSVMQAEKLAKEKAEKISREIIEKAIDESKEEANEIKKDIIKSAGRHAKKESEQIIKEELRRARKKSQIKAEEIISSAIIESKLSADEIKKEMLDKTKASVKEVMDNLTQSIITNGQQEVSQSEDLQAKISESMKESIDQVLNTKNQIIDEINQNRENTMKEINESKNQTIGGIRDSIYQATKLSEEIKNQLNEAAKIKETLSEKMKENIDQNMNFKNEILEEMKDHYDKICEDISNHIRKTVDEIKQEISINANQKIQEVQNSCQNQDITKETSKENEFVKKLLNVKENDGGAPEMYADNWKKPKFFYSPDDQTENIDFLRQRISEKMKDAYDSSVIATISNEVDMSAIISLEKAFGEAFSKKYNTRLGFTPFFIMAAVEALKQFKIFNAHVHEDEIIYKNHFDISVITCGNDGISAPVIRDADKLNFAEIEKKMITLSRRAVEGTLSLEEVSNGTFTVVNAGMYGSLMGTDILTPPQVATLSVHKMHNRPVATNEGVEIKPMLYVSLSYDHRIADTKLAAEFLSKIKNYVENPGWQLLGL